MIEMFTAVEIPTRHYIEVIEMFTAVLPVKCLPHRNVYCGITGENHSVEILSSITGEIRSPETRNSAV